jgi:DNA-binding NarL/FixJ family response regulator
MHEHRTDQPPDAPQQPPEVTVLAADDQEQFLRAARNLVRATPGFTLAALARSGEEAITLVGELDPQIVLIDARMPGIGGIEAARHIVDRYAATVVVLVSIDDIDALPRAARSCGATAIINKVDLSPATLRDLWHKHRPR